MTFDLLDVGNGGEANLRCFVENSFGGGLIDQEASKFVWRNSGTAGTAISMGSMFGWGTFRAKNDSMGSVDYENHTKFDYTDGEGGKFPAEGITNTTSNTNLYSTVSRTDTTYVNMPTWDLRGMPQMAKSTEVSAADGTDFSMRYMFDNLDAVKHVRMGDTEPEAGTLMLPADFYTGSTKDMRNMFYNCNRLETVELEDIIQTNNLPAWGMFESCLSLKDLSFANTANPAAGPQMTNFAKGCASLEHVTFGSGTFQFKPTYLNNAFYGCKALRDLDLRSMDTSGTLTSNANGQTAHAPTWTENAYGDTGMNNLFAGCDAILSEPTGDSPRAVITIGTGCTRLFNGFFWQRGSIGSR